MGGPSRASAGVDARRNPLHYASRTIVFADVVESVRLMQRDEFAAAGRIRELLLEAATLTIPRHRGQLLQRLGDGAMIAFADPCDAIECACALHLRAAKLSRGAAAADRILLRIGAHTADIITDD